MAYVDSNNIKVFPSAKRGIDYPESRLTTEANFVNIINKLINYDGFVISTEFDENDPFEFNIHGYYFYINKGINLLSKLNISVATDIYAGISLTLVGDNLELADSDFSGEYQGISFSTGSAPIDCDYSLKILSRDDTSSNWRPVNNVRFNQESLDLAIDGGII